ncbi:MAG: OmpA family protein [Gammaproteobacteria bacterium]|nr:OmpA family protein [Gammaproteobacteria bacterium]
MKKFTLGSLMAVIAAYALAANIAVAHEGGKANEAYVGDMSKHYILDSSGNCVRTSSWSKKTATKECNPELFPEEKKAEAPPVPPPPPQPVYEKVTISATALFDFNKAVVKPDGKTAIRELADTIKAKGAQVVDINVIGHTDSVGPEEYNQQLSVRRATAVKDYMVTQGIDAGIIDVSGKGESSPVADNGTKEGRALNRRVEIQIGANAPK